MKSLTLYISAVGETKIVQNLQVENFLKFKNTTKTTPKDNINI